jgi:hypothetical protein
VISQLQAAACLQTYVLLRNAFNVRRLGTTSSLASNHPGISVLPPTFFTCSLQSRTNPQAADIAARRIRANSGFLLCSFVGSV